MSGQKEDIRTLKAESIAKRYKNRWVVKDVSLEVSTGQIVGLLGPNGAGKTTAFYMLVGLVRANKGTVILDNNDITTMPMHLRARSGIGYLPQEASIFRKLSVENNIMSILETRKELTSGQREEIMEGLLQEFNIQHIRESDGISLSGGERRRTEIARALAASPKFILLDEPFAGVDPISVIDIKKIITHLKNRGIGVLITDHNVRETLDVCEHAYIMNSGSVIAEGTPEHILDHEEVRKVYLGEQFRL
jgi:lipopolysaccharide export system ATP-binding protein